MRWKHYALTWAIAIAAAVGLFSVTGIVFTTDDDVEREHVWMDMPPGPLTISGCRDGVLYDLFLYDSVDWEDPFGEVVVSSEPLLWVIPDAGRCDDDPSDEANEPDLLDVLSEMANDAEAD